MTTPGQGAPDGAFSIAAPGAYQYAQTMNESTAKAIISNGVVGSFQDAQDTHNTNVVTPLGQKANVTDVPVNSAIWQSMNKAEQGTFPRANIVLVTASVTGSATVSSTPSSHTHSINQYAVVPDYQPSGSGTNYLEIGFIRITKNCTFSNAGFITGNASTFAGITACYIGVFQMNATTGDLTLLNTGTAGSDISSSVTLKNTEHLVSLGMTQTALQDETYAVGLLQITNSFQTAASIMATRTTDLSRDTTSAYPQKQYAYAGTYSAMPTTISQSSLNYSASTKLPFYYVREN